MPVSVITRPSQKEMNKQKLSKLASTKHTVIISSPRVDSDDDHPPPSPARSDDDADTIVSEISSYTLKRMEHGVCKALPLGFHVNA